jgi:N-methylhydantoinase B
MTSDRQPTATVSAEPKARATDITREIISGRLNAIVDEMAIVLARASMSPVVYEVLDFACGICDADGNLVAQTNGITLFTGTFSSQVRFIRDRFAADLQPGDTFLSNDPFEGGTHACDFAVIRPVFAGGAPIAWAIVVAHLLDVGGAVPGSLPPDATSVFQEGLRLSGVRLTRGDRLIDDVVRIITENVRLPTLAMGDVNAEIAAVRIAERRLIETADKYGRDVLAGVFAETLLASEAEARKAVAALPDGEYTAEDVFDGDGLSDEPVPVRVVVRVTGDHMEVDFTGSSGARDAPINCSVGALQSAVKTIFKALVAPHEPSNEGWFRPLTVVVPPGTVFSAAKPKPTGWYYEASAQASELVWKALAPLVPERFSAGSYMSLCATYITGRTDAGEFVHIEPQHGGWGGSSAHDGASGLIAVTDGDTYNYSIELLESKFPLLVRRYGYDVDGGVGAGRRRGGFGLVREYEIEAEGTNLHASFGRNRTPAWGADGGGPGGVNSIEVIRGPKKVRLTRTPGFRLEPLDLVRIITAGGGGWGSAFERPAEMVVADVRDGLITPAAARAAYGVAIDPASFDVDHDATALLRAGAERPNRGRP